MPLRLRPTNVRKAITNVAVGAVSLVILLSAVSYVAFGPTTSVAFANGVVTPIDGKTIVLYGAVTTDSGAPLGVRVTANCTTVAKASDAAVANASSCSATKHVSDGVFRLELTGCNQSECAIEFTVQSPKHTGSTTIMIRPGSTQRVDATVTTSHNKLFTWLPGASY